MFPQLMFFFCGYIRVLGSQNPDIHIYGLMQSLAAAGLTAKLEVDTSEGPGKWTMLDILNAAAEPIARLERNTVVAGELGQNELDEFKEAIQNCKPASAVKWLTKYFDKVKVIYAFQMLNAAFKDGNFEVVNNIKRNIWKKVNGILQADNEGFSNEAGDHILWQFPENASGDWSCSVRNWLGRWDKFVMDLSDDTQRQEFRDGKVPKNAKRV